MVEVIFDNVPVHVEDGTIQTWYFEEGDPVNEGDDLCELATEDGPVTVPAPASGVLAEVYYDEGELVGRGEVLCTIDNEESDKKEKD